MLYDSGVAWYAGNTKPAGCWNQFSLRGVATHEFGHAFGLDHSPGDSCNLTMYPSTGPCNDGARSFGLGDVEGLESIY
jgi:predicted Zn-dependent protease